jgi:hypothetical protein
VYLAKSEVALFVGEIIYFEAKACMEWYRLLGTGPVGRHGGYTISHYSSKRSYSTRKGFVVFAPQINYKFQ